MVKPDGRQLDLFVALIGDIPTRDQRETMERPFFSLQKTPRTTPIDYKAGNVWVKVIPHPEFGMATIWDADILIWAASQITLAKNKGLEISRTLRVRPYELLKAIHREPGGRQYQLLKEALARLKTTTITTSIRADKKKGAMFSWIDEWEYEEDEEGRPVWINIELSKWLFDGIVVRGGVLKIADTYFDLTGGLERWLYRVARKHGGYQPDGWRFSMAQLHQKSGSTREVRKFAAEIREIIARNDLPEYALELVTLENGEEGVQVCRRKGHRSVD